MNSTISAFQAYFWDPGERDWASSPSKSWSWQRSKDITCMNRRHSLVKTLYLRLVSDFHIIKDAKNVEKQKKLLLGTAKFYELPPEKVSRWFDLWQDRFRPSLLDKFVDRSWSLLVAIALTVFELTILWKKSWFWDSRYCWQGHPCHPLEVEVIFLFKIELVVHASQLMSEVSTWHSFCWRITLANLIHLAEKCLVFSKDLIHRLDLCYQLCPSCIFGAFSEEPDALFDRGKVNLT